MSLFNRLRLKSAKNILRLRTGCLFHLKWHGLSDLSPSRPFRAKNLEYSQESLPQEDSAGSKHVLWNHLETTVKTQLQWSCHWSSVCISESPYGTTYLCRLYIWAAEGKILWTPRMMAFLRHWQRRNIFVFVRPSYVGLIRTALALYMTQKLTGYFHQWFWQCFDPRKTYIALNTKIFSSCYCRYCPEDRL